MNLTYDTVNQTCVIESDKMVTPIRVEKKPHSHHFFHVKFEKGDVPQELSGKYSSVRAGVKAVETYLRNKKETVAARRKNFTEERNKRNGSKTRTKGSKHVHEGSDN